MSSPIHPLPLPYNSPIKLGFDTRTIELSLEQVLPLKTIPESIKQTQKYKQILASIREVGIIEPPVVAPNRDKINTYLMLDGHLRLAVLRDLGAEKVLCLVSRDDEAFTYNKHVSRLSVIQEHHMIREAIKRGVSPAKIAQALNINVGSIIEKCRLIDGICPEAIELLKDKIVPAKIFRILKQFKAVRQVEAAHLMNDTGTYSLPYARAILQATSPEQMLNPEKRIKTTSVSPEKMARMGAEMDYLQREYRLVESSYSSDVLNLTLARGYLGTLLGNARITRYLHDYHPEILDEFQKIADMTTLAGTEAPAA